MRRVVVAGGRGFFGRTVVELLRTGGLAPLVPVRAELDVEDPGSLRAALRRGDVVIDAAGPYQARTTTLIESAMEIGADVVDLNESLPYARRVRALGPRIAASGIAVLSSCSAVSAVAAALLRESRVERPARVHALVAPASRETASPGTLRALLASIGAPIEVWRGGGFRRATGWRESRLFPTLGRRAHLVESALSLDLPSSWPSLRDVDCWTDTSTPAANALLSLVSRAPLLRALAMRAVPLGILLARLAGARRGAFAIEVQDERGGITGLALVAERGSYRIAAAPAVLAATRLAEERSPEGGLVSPDRQLRADELLPYLMTLGLELDVRGAGYRPL